jgi:hypothetical protein
MTKKKSLAPAADTAVKSATALARMAKELEKDEAVASSESAANTSSLDAMATAVEDQESPEDCQSLEDWQDTRVKIQESNS